MPYSFYQNYFYHYYFSHFLPLHLNGERKSGKDLEMTKKCAIFVPDGFDVYL